MTPPSSRRPLRFLLAGALALLPAAGAPRAGAEEPDALPGLLAPLRADDLARRGHATFRHSEAEPGGAGAAFDGKPGTALRTLSVNPAFLEVTFPRPREILSAEAFFPGGAPHEWSLLAGEDPEALTVMFQRRRVAADSWSRVERFAPPVRARVFRVVVMRLDGRDDVAFGEIALVARQVPESLEILAPSTVVCPDGPMALRARVLYDGGLRTGGAPGLAFESAGGKTLLLEPRGPSDPHAVTARFREAGADRVRAFLPDRRGGRIESPWAEVECRAEGKPDWCVGWIERAPRLPLDGKGGPLPAAGDSVVYRAHVRNYGTADAPRAPFRWEVDGKAVDDGSLEPIPRFGTEVRELRRNWDGLRHEVRFTVDPAGAREETSEGNNSVAIRSDALRLGFWVERPVIDGFHGSQSRFGDGANGFEDWAQRQVARWNRMLAGARYPGTPEGITDRVALDLVVEVDEGALPLGTGAPDRDPDAGDRTVDLQRGFPASLLDGAYRPASGEKRDDNPLWFDGRLLRALSRARYLADLDRLDVRAAEVALRGAGDAPLAGSPALPLVDRDLVHRTRSGVMTCGVLAGGYGPHEARALERIAGRRARGGNREPPPEQGEYLADLPRRCGVRVLDADGAPLDGVTVRAFRRAPGPEGRESLGGAPVRSGLSSGGGTVDLSPAEVDPFFEGRKEGPLDAGRGILLLELSRGGRSCWRFLEVVPFNMAYWSGAEAEHLEDVPTDLPR